MKNYIVLLASVLLLNTSCKKEATHTTFPNPSWTVDQTGKYPVSMTAVVTMYYNLNADLSEQDKMGAFVNDECRGFGTQVKISPISTVFFVHIRGTAAEQGKIKFKYYSSKTSYMYQTSDFLTFKVDSNFGTADKPEILDLKPVD